MDIRPATAADWDDVSALLQGGELPLGGLSDQFPAAYSLAICDERVAGVVGLERPGTTDPRALSRRGDLLLDRAEDALPLGVEHLDAHAIARLQEWRARCAVLHELEHAAL